MSDLEYMSRTKAIARIEEKLNESTQRHNFTAILIVLQTGLNLLFVLMALRA